MLLIKVALAPLPIYRSWTKKSREKTLRLEKEIVMLRQLLDNALPEDASSYLTLVSQGLREIEEVIYDRNIHLSYNILGNRENLHFKEHLYYLLLGC